MKVDQINGFLAEAFPYADFNVESVGDKRAVIRQPISAQHLRPGGTVSGPTMMMVVDVALYTAILGVLGKVEMAVTTNLNINFLRKPVADRDIIGECRLHKVGRTLVVGEVSIFSDGQEEPVAHAVGTYALPAGESIS